MVQRFDKIHRLLVHRQNILTSVDINGIYDIGVANTFFSTPRNVHDTDPGPASRCYGFFGTVWGYESNCHIPETVQYSTRYAVSWCTSGVIRPMT